MTPAPDNVFPNKVLGSVFRNHHCNKRMGTAMEIEAHASCTCTSGAWKNGAWVTGRDFARVITRVYTWTRICTRRRGWRRDAVEKRRVEEGERKSNGVLVNYSPPTSPGVVVTDREELWLHGNNAIGQFLTGEIVQWLLISRRIVAWKMSCFWLDQSGSSWRIRDLGEIRRIILHSATMELLICMG